MPRTGKGGGEAVVRFMCPDCDNFVFEVNAERPNVQRSCRSCHSRYKILAKRTPARSADDLTLTYAGKFAEPRSSRA